eukprot:TRINITY_DN8819_c0_g1_i2.p1 TRINITY_DN8819_c0_g1~~TRINITY_DN8819_c0_g1_i2.p1  ORF type:complete len:112 (+),score=23.36 TRINITY_DN8819_c0_g1_i2:17-352(+)
MITDSVASVNLKGSLQITHGEATYGADVVLFGGLMSWISPLRGQETVDLRDCILDSTTSELEWTIIFHDETFKFVAENPSVAENWKSGLSQAMALLQEPEDDLDEEGWNEE